MRKSLYLLALPLLLADAGWPADQATFRVIAYMDRYDQPIGIIEGSPGVFYSESGNAVLSVTTQGSKTILANFPNNAVLLSLAVAGSDGLFYSTIWTEKATTAEVFSVPSMPAGLKLYSPQTIAPFLMQNLPDSKFLGLAGGVSSHLYSLVTTDLHGNVTPIYQFTSADQPETALYASDGNYYGVVQGATASTGYVFRITPSGSFTKLFTFPTNTFIGAYYQPLIEASDGNLYGATATGGANGTGTIYKLTLGGQYTLLYTFPKGNSYNPSALIEGSDGNLYGATIGSLANAGFSELFKLTKSGQFTLLYAMANVGADGACNCKLVQGSDGMIYGSAQVGGITGAGAYFSLDAGLPKPRPHAQHFSPKSGAVGTQVLIWGFNLLSASVNFNGVPATTVSSSGPNYVWATVPAGATTGPITITTPGGSFTTTNSFTVQ